MIVFTSTNRYSLSQKDFLFKYASRSVCLNSNPNYPKGANTYKIDRQVQQLAKKKKASDVCSSTCKSRLMNYIEEAGLCR